jgi:hypothetical protein
VPDRPGGRPGDEDLPPDPWAPAPPSGDPSGVPPSGAAGPWDAPPGQAQGDPFGVPPTRSRALWQHPAFWVAVVVLALILLVGALLEPRPAPPGEPSPDAVTTTGSGPRV